MSFALGTALGLVGGAAAWPVARRYLRAYRRSGKSLAEEVQWGVLISDGLVWNKDGSFTAAWEVSGPDLTYETPRQADALADLMNRALGLVGERHMLHVDTVRVPSTEYASGKALPPPVGTLTDRLRRERYRSGEHFENRSFVALTYQPGSERSRKIANLLYTSPSRQEIDWRTQIEDVERRAKAFEDRLPPALQARRLRSGDLTSYLHLMLTGRPQRVEAPDRPVRLDYLFGEDLVAGFEPKLGARWHRVVSIQGYPRAFVGITEPLRELPFPYRFSNRLIGVRQEAARSLAEKRMRKWISDSQDLRGQMRQSTEEGRSEYSELFEDRHARGKAEDAAKVQEKLRGGKSRMMHHSACVIVASEDLGEANRRARKVEKALQNGAGGGFKVFRERGLATEALVGSWPGHGNQNVRRYPVLSEYAARLLPLTSTYPGPEATPCRVYGDDAPPLFYAQTSENVPYRYSPYSGDVGHQIIIGPTGTGKSVLMAFQAMRHLQFPGSRAVLLDNGGSFAPLCEALGGTRRNVGGGAEEGFQPLAGIDDPEERRWALGWVLSLLKFQNVAVQTRHRRLIQDALETMAAAGSCGARSYRTLHELHTQVQDREIKDALAPYCGGGALGMLLDAEEDSLREKSRLQVLELSSLLELSEAIYTPVLLYLFHRIERMLGPERPTYVGADEFFLFAAKTDVGREYALEAFRTYRKKGAMMTVATQLPEDVVGSGMEGVLSSCPSRIFLPNPDALGPAQREGYEGVGLGRAEIEAVAAAVPKREYLAKQPAGTRKFDLGLSRAELAFLTAAGDLSLEETAEKMRAHKAEYGPEGWVGPWLRFCGVEPPEHLSGTREPQPTAGAAS